MFIKTLGNVLLGQLKNGNFVRTFSQKGKTVTEVLNPAGEVLQRRVKTISHTSLKDDCFKYSFEDYNNFSKKVFIGRILFSNQTNKYPRKRLFPKEQV